MAIRTAISFRIMLGTQNSGVNMLSVPVNPGGATPIAVKL
jgi:hypothetical protein